GPGAELRPRGEEDDRDPARRRLDEELLGDPPAVEPRHHHVEEDHVGRVRARLLETARAVGRLEDLHSLRLEIDPAQQPDRRLVVDYENLRHRLARTPALYPPQVHLIPPLSEPGRARAAARTRTSSPRPPRTRRRCDRPSPRRDPAR